MSSTTVPNTTRIQSYQTLLYAKPLVPDLYHPSDSRTHIHDYYSLNLSISAGTHACTFTTVDGCATELVSDFPLANADMSLVESLMCSAEKDFEHTISRTKIHYITAAQTEQLTTHIYNDTYDELDQLARDQEALTHRWTDQTGQCLSILDAQQLADQVHLQGYHLIASENLVLRTQSIFELKR